MQLWKGVHIEKKGGCSNGNVRVGYLIVSVENTEHVASNLF